MLYILYVIVYVSVYDFCHLKKSEDCALHGPPSTFSLGYSFYPVQAVPEPRSKVLFEPLFLIWNSLPFPSLNVYNPTNAQDPSQIPPPPIRKSWTGNRNYFKREEQDGACRKKTFPWEVNK